MIFEGKVQRVHGLIGNTHKYIGLCVYIYSLKARLIGRSFGRITSNLNTFLLFIVIYVDILHGIPV